ncbi:MAG: alpha/beta hydrolase [Firmicutes bacterium]|nr:alpha/beta hydrolase [Bacillota bacterium]
MKVNIKRDGLNLVGELFAPDKETYDLVIICHGFTGHRNEDHISLLTKCLLEKGIASLRFDFNGHGESEGDFHDMNLFNEICDVQKVLEYVQSLPQVQNISIAGHSQGGVVASMIAGYYPEVFKKVALLAPAATLKDDAQKGECMGTVYDPKCAPDTLALMGGEHKLGGFYFRIAQSLPIYEIAAQYEKEVCLIHGLADTIVDKVASQRYHQHYKNSQLYLLEGADHGFSNDQQKAIDIAVEYLAG